MKLAIAAVLALTSVAHADDKPDPRAVEAANEANLESKAPRYGFTLAAALGGSLVLGNGAVGRGGAGSFRFGHVATSSTVITFELALGGVLHKVDTMGGTKADSDVNFLAGGQVYVNPSLWFRMSGGFGVFTKYEATKKATLPGPSALFGVGVDLIRRKYLVLGFEAFTVGKLHRDGVLATTGLCLGLSYY